MDLNTMLRETALSGLNAELDVAVQNGDAVAARKVTQKIADLAVSVAPKAPAYGDAEVRAELNKQEWFGTDPKRSAKALEFGKTMNPAKFPTADAFAAAIVKAVDAEFAPPADIVAEEEEDEDGEPVKKKDPPVAKKRTDGPKDGEGSPRTSGSGTDRQWSKLTDAPPEVRAEIKRQAAKFLPAAATDAQKDAFTKRALGASYAAAQAAKKGK